MVGCPIRWRERFMSRAISLLAALAAILFSILPASAVTINTVPVGNPGNVGDVQSQGTFGAVGYAYRIGTTEVTNAQYAEFLNAKAASDPLGLYDTNMVGSYRGITRSGLSGSYTYATAPGRENKPVVFVSWYDSIRFANWLNNGQGNGDTETGAYTILGGTSTPSNERTITRNPGATWFLPSENEWYKAAYHKNDGPSDNYFHYPTSSDALPTAAPPPGGSNSANIAYAAGNLTDVGAYAASLSPYGTLDQAGNVFEWNETFINDYYPSRVFRGGAWDQLSTSPWSAGMSATTRPIGVAWDKNQDIGFRVATVPEPSTLALAILAALGACFLARRRSA
jgi:formylglycine-generating enzyme